MSAFCVAATPTMTTTPQSLAFISARRTEPTPKNIAGWSTFCWRIEEGEINRARKRGPDWASGLEIILVPVLQSRPFPPPCANLGKEGILKHCSVDCKRLLPADKDYLHGFLAVAALKEGKRILPACEVVSLFFFHGFLAVAALKATDPLLQSLSPGFSTASWPWPH